MIEPDLRAAADLTKALALNGPDAALQLYRDWAATYDSTFAAGMEYNLPAHVARAFLAAKGEGPVLDVGAGTGLLAQSLRDMGLTDPIDGLDFSTEMLARAAEKNLYRRLIHADVTKPLPVRRHYNGITSSGTFTSGHVGPAAFGPMLDIALPNALFSLSVNQRVWTNMGFDTALKTLEQSNHIHDLQRIEVQVYGTAAQAIDPDHANDRAWIVLFRAT